MHQKTIKPILVALGVTIGMTATSNQAAQAQTKPKVTSQNNGATELTEVKVQTQSIGPWASGEGMKQKQENYQIKQRNGFFDSVTVTPKKAEQLFNRNSNVGDRVPNYGELKFLDF